MDKPNSEPDLDTIWLDEMDNLSFSNAQVFDSPAKINPAPLSDIVTPIVAGLFVFGLVVFWLEKNG